MSKYIDKHMIHTDVYKPSEKMCCEACVFGRGEHVEGCVVETARKKKEAVEKLRQWLEEDLAAPRVYATHVEYGK